MEAEPKPSEQDESRSSELSSVDDLSDVESDSEAAQAKVEWLATARQRRTTAGNRMKTMLANEEPDSDMELLFAEDDDDQGFSDDAENASDVQMDSSSDDDDDDENNANDELEGERELEKQDKARRAAQRKRKAQAAIPAKFRKKVRIDTSATTPSSTAATTPAPQLSDRKKKKKSERTSWLPSAADMPTRASSRQTTRLSKEQLHAQMEERERKRLKQLAQMEKKAARLEALKKPPMTQEDRLREAAEVEERNSKSLNRWEEAEKQREDERRAKLAALHERTLKGPVITFWSGKGRFGDGFVKSEGINVVVEEKPKKQKKEKVPKEPKGKDKKKIQAEGEAGKTDVNGSAPETVAKTESQADATKARDVQAPATNGDAKTDEKKESNASANGEPEVADVTMTDAPAPKEPDAKEPDTKEPEAKETGPTEGEAKAQDKPQETDAPQEDTAETAQAPKPDEKAAETANATTESPTEARTAAPSEETSKQTEAEKPKVSQPTAKEAEQIKTEDAEPASTPAEKPVEKATEQPVEKATEQPVEKATEQPTEQQKQPKADDGAQNDDKPRAPAQAPREAAPEAAPEATPTAPTTNGTNTTQANDTAPQPAPTATTNSTNTAPQNPTETSPQQPTEPKNEKDGQPTTRNAISYQNFNQNAIRDKPTQTQILFGRKMNRLPKPAPQPICPITGSFARYRDPVTNMAFYSAAACKELKRVAGGEYRWSKLLGAWVGSGSYAARGVPERFLNPDRCPTLEEVQRIEQKKEARIEAEKKAKEEEEAAKKKKDKEESGGSTKEKGADADADAGKSVEEASAEGDVKMEDGAPAVESTVAAA